MNPSPVLEARVEPSAAPPGALAPLPTPEEEGPEILTTGRSGLSAQALLVLK